MNIPAGTSALLKYFFSEVGIPIYFIIDMALFKQIRCVGSTPILTISYTEHNIYSSCRIGVQQHIFPNLVIAAKRS